MERVMKTSRTCLDPVIHLLEELSRTKLSGSRMPTSVLEGFTQSIDTMKLDMTFFKMFFWGLSYLEESCFDWHLRFTLVTMVSRLSEAAVQFAVNCDRWDHDCQSLNWEVLSCDLEARIEHFKPQAEQICIYFSMGMFKCKACQHNQWDSFLEYGRESDSFIGSIKQCFDVLLFDFPKIRDSNPVMQQQILFIQRRLKEFGNFASPGNHSVVRVKNFGELLFYHRTWVFKISCLACLYNLCWIDGMDERAASTMGGLVYNLMFRTVSFAPGVVASCLERRVIPQLLGSYVDFLLQDLVITSPSGSENLQLQEGLIFLWSFFLHPYHDKDFQDRGFILEKVYGMLINELPSLIRSVHLGKANYFSAFLEKTDEVKVEVRDAYFMDPHTSEFDFPKTDPIGFLDSLLGRVAKLVEAKVNFLPLTKCRVKVVQVELFSLRPFLQSCADLRNEQGELRDLWVRTLDVVYHAGFVINLCSAKVVHVWYSIVCLSNVMKDIKFIKNDIKKLEDEQVFHKRGSLSAEMRSSIAVPTKATNSKSEVDFIGFEEDVRSIVNHLLRGPKDLKIISISGMAGQGKTTLAKRIYNDLSVQHHFYKIVWSYVSKECTVRELLVQIASNVVDLEYDDMLALRDDEVVERLWKCLKRCRYLIVMDDIWEVGLWHQVQLAFPNDQVGSRILFTSRNHDLASQAESNSISHQLRLFSDEESWDLMKMKLSHSGGCPPELSDSGKQIAIYCKGLPLAVSLISAVLTRIDSNLETWNQLAKNLKSHLASEGCREVIDLSYRNLPDHLKPCFLYLGTFPRGERVRAKKLCMLWIAEGFIKDDDETQCLEDLASGYLSNLVSQNLLVVTERTSMGKIKRCNVHDLLYDFCLEKAVEENFSHWAEESSVIGWCNSSTSQKFDHYRLCVGKTDPLIKPRPLLTREELPTSQVQSLLWFHPDMFLNQNLAIFLEGFKVLTTLDLEVVLEKEDSPEVIMSNIHLRHMSLKFSDEITIPSSINNLWNLETVMINGQGLVSLPLAMWRMKSLKHVCIKNWRLYSKDCDSFAACDLETLGLVFLSYDRKIEEIFQKLTKLRKLSCHIEGESGEEMHPKWFSMFSSLKRLESLKIQGSCKKFPTLNSPMIENLKKLTLSGLQLPWGMISTIGRQLPSLEVLKLLRDACSGASWELEDDDSFSNVRYLKLAGLDIVEIDFSSCDSCPFPSLEEFVVDSCDRLEEIPSDFGDIYTLNMIRLLGSSTHEARCSVQQVLQEQRDLGNDILQVIVEHDGIGEGKEEKS